MHNLKLEMKIEVIAEVENHSTVAVLMSNLYNGNNKKIDKWNLVHVFTMKEEN